MSLTKRALIITLAIIAVLSMTSMGCGGKKSDKRGLISKGADKADPNAAPKDGLEGDANKDGVVDEAETKALEEAKLAEAAGEVADDGEIKAVEDIVQELINGTAIVSKSNLVEGSYMLENVSTLFVYKSDEEKMAAFMTSGLLTEVAEGKFTKIELESNSDQAKQVGSMSDEADAGLRLDLPIKFLVKKGSDGSEWAPVRGEGKSLNDVLSSKYSHTDKGLKDVLRHKFDVSDFSAEGIHASVLEILASGSATEDGAFKVEEGKRSFTVYLRRAESDNTFLRVVISDETKAEDKVKEHIRTVVLDYRVTPAEVKSEDKPAEDPAPAADSGNWANSDTDSGAN